MVFPDVAARPSATVTGLISLVMGFIVISGCVEEPRPRSYIEFMEDPIAREGTLARCNQDRNATADDVECINARRAASTVAARAEAARAQQLEASSELKREARRDRIAEQQAAARRAEEAARQAEEAAYDAQWSEVQPSAPGPQFAPTAGMPPQPGTDTSGSAYRESDVISSPGAAPQQAPATQPEQLSFIEVPRIQSPVTLSEIQLPPIARPLQPEPEPKLEELTIPRPFRSPEPQ